MGEPSDELGAFVQPSEETLRQQLRDTERENTELRAKVADLFQADTINLLDSKLKTAYERVDALNRTIAAVRAAVQEYQVPDGMELGRAVKMVLAVTKGDVRHVKQAIRIEREEANKELLRVQKDVHDVRQALGDAEAKTAEWRSRYTRDVSGERLDAREIRERVRHERRRERVKVCDELLAFMGRWRLAR